MSITALLEEQQRKAALRAEYRETMNDVSATADERRIAELQLTVMDNDVDMKAKYNIYRGRGAQYRDALLQSEARAKARRELEKFGIV